jgi:hypothetical protein
MSNPNFTTLTVTSGSTLTGGANITGTCNTNNINILNNGNFIQNGSGSLTTGSGNFYLNGSMIGTGQTATLGTITCNTLTSGQINANNSLFIGNAGFLQLPSNKQITSSNDVVDTANTQTISGAKTFSSQIVANGGINAGSNSITCGSLTCSSENDTGALTVTGALNANGGIVTNTINAGTGSITCGSLTCSSENDTGALTVTGQINANGGLTIPANQTLSISRKVSGFQQKVWNCNDLGLSSNPSSRYLLIAQNGALSSYGNNFGVLTLKGQIGIENGAVTNIIFFDIQIGTRGGVSTNGYVNSYYSLSTITTYLDFIVTSTSSGNNFYLYLKSPAYFMFEFVAGGNEYSSTPLLNEPTSTGATFASGETVVVSSVINNVVSNSSNFYYGNCSINSGSLSASRSCTITNTSGSVSTLTLLPTNTASTTNTRIILVNDLNAGSYNYYTQAGDAGLIFNVNGAQGSGSLMIAPHSFSVASDPSLRISYSSGTAISGSLTVKNGTSSSNSVLQISPNSTYTQINCVNGDNSLTQPLVLNNNNGYGVCINTSTAQNGYQLTVNGSITTNNNNINAGSGSVTCSSITCGSILPNNNCNISYFNCNSKFVLVCFIVN